MHNKKIEDVFKKLNTSEKGLSTSEANNRILYMIGCWQEEPHQKDPRCQTS